MIVRKTWTTRTKKFYKFHFNGETFSYRERQWVGYFLFGIIPLFVATTNTIYSK